MALREKFGRLILLEQTEGGALGREYRAARLGPAGLDRLVTVLRFSPAISGHAEATKRLMEEARIAARLANPGLVRVLGIGRVEQSFYLSTELVEGRSLAAILERCRSEAFPFAADHALMVASRGASALEGVHARKDEAGAPLIHGLVTPARVVVAFDGEIKIKGLGLWAALRSTELLPEEERRYLAPEQAAGGVGGPRSDVYSLGLVLLEALTGQAPGGDALDALADARVTNASGEQSPLPKPLEDLLRRALAPDPGARFGGMSDLRKALDAMTFSGDFAPTTFDLAFFMHTLFREEMEAEARALEEARVADYREFLPEEKAATPPPPAPTPTTEPEPLPVSTVSLAAPTEVPPPTQAESGPAAPERPLSAPPSDSSGSRPAAPRSSRDTSAREAAARMTLGSAPEPESRRGLGLLLGLAAAVVLGGGAGWFYFARVRPASTPATTLSPEAAAAQARVRELEARIAQLEKERTEAETAAAEDARRTVEAQAGGKPVDPAAVERAQEEARRRARAEQERKQQEEMARLASEKAAEEQRLAEASPPPEPVPVPTPTPTPTPTPEAPAPAAGEPAAPAGVPASGAVTPSGAGAAPATVTPSGVAEFAPPAGAAGVPTAQPPAAAAAVPPVPTPTPVRRGALVDISDPAVTAPVLIRQPAVSYPQVALQARVEGVVELRVLIDENGNVIDIKLVKTTRPGYRFEAEADRHTRGRKYRPATKGGVPVRVWLPIVVNFKSTR